MERQLAGEFPRETPSWRSTNLITWSAAKVEWDLPAAKPPGSESGVMGISGNPAPEVPSAHYLVIQPSKSECLCYQFQAEQTARTKAVDETEGQE